MARTRIPVGIGAILFGILASRVWCQICPSDPEVCPAMYLQVSKINGESVEGGSCTTCDVRAGDLLEVEVWGRCWSMTFVACRAYQVTLSRESCLTGDAGDVLPWMFFETTDPFHECPSEPFMPMNNEGAMFVDIDHPDWIFSGQFLALWASNTKECDYKVASAMSSPGILGLCTQGIQSKAYLATLMLEVSNDALGVFEVELASYLLGGLPASRFSFGPGTFVPGVGFEPVILNVVTDPIDPCPDDPEHDIDGDAVCGDMDNCPHDFNPDQEDANKDGIGDACEKRIPTVSEWGLVIMTLLLLSTAKIYFTRRCSRTIPVI